MEYKIGVLVYVKKGDRYLMLHRDKKKNDFHQGMWIAPGGKREPNESLTACARRELEEETGLISQKLKFLGFLHFPDTGNSPFGGEWVDFVFLCDEFTGRSIEQSPEGTLRWVNGADIYDLPMWEGDKIFTEYVLEERLFSLCIIYDGRHVVSVTKEDII